MAKPQDEKDDDKPSAFPKVPGATPPDTKPPEERDRENKPQPATVSTAKEIPDDLKAQGFDARAWKAKSDSQSAGYFFLKVIPADDRGNTHLAKNATHTWIGTEEQFKANFERE